MKNSSLCWICGAAANTREHTIKQSDIRRLFGTGPYAKGKRLVRTDEGGSKKIIQSEDSVHIKYQQSLCEHCNSGRSQPWDEAYDNFMEFVQAHAQELKRTLKIDLNRIVQNHGNEFAENLYSYLVKAFGCQLQEHGQQPPLELSEYLLGKRNNTNLIITFSVYTSIPQQLSSPMVQIHNLEGDVEVDMSRLLNYTWAVSVEWLTIVFWYNKQPTIELGHAWDGTFDQIRMGSYKDRNSVSKKN